MKKNNQFSQLGLYVVIAVAIFSLSIVLSSSGRYFFKKNNSEISVTGSASLNFTSDLVVWGGDFTSSNKDLKKRYIKLMRESHPDKGYDDEWCKKINEAYQKIVDYRNNVNGFDKNLCLVPKKFRETVLDRQREVSSWP